MPRKNPNPLPPSKFPIMRIYNFRCFMKMNYSLALSCHGKIIAEHFSMLKN